MCKNSRRIAALCLWAVMSGAIAGVADYGAPARAAEDARPTSTKPQTNSIGMQLVRIPAGKFTMGRTESADELAKAFPDYDRERIDGLSDDNPTGSGSPGRLSWARRK